MPSKQVMKQSEPQTPDTALNKGTLREVVKQALLDILSDKSAPAAAKASACRALLDHFGDQDHSANGKRTSEMTLEELDAAIESHSLPR